jgi:protein disulfide isomerase
LYGEITQENFKGYMERRIPLVWSFINPEDASTRVTHDKVIAEVAANIAGASFVWIDGTKFAGMAQRMGLSGALPGVAVEKDGKYFMYDVQGAPAEAATLSTLVSGVIAGTIKPTVKSAEPPASNPDEEGVWVLTAKTFEDEVLNSGKDVFVEFYAPWCGHCKSLAPEYAKLAQTVRGVSTLRIAKFDATENDAIEGFEVTGYPTLFLVQAEKNGGRGTIMPYVGGRTKDEIFDFILDHATFDVKV